MKTKKRYLKKEDQIIQTCLKSSKNLTEAFERASALLNRSKNSIAGRYYTMQEQKNKHKKLMNFVVDSQRNTKNVELNLGQIKSITIVNNQLIVKL